jgi:hypothetical protein
VRQVNREQRDRLFKNEQVSRTVARTSSAAKAGLPDRRYFGGCNSPLLTQPEALPDLSGSPASQFSQ